MMDVTSGGSADTAGAKENDRLVEINGENVEEANHEQAVEKVHDNKHGLQCVIPEGLHNIETIFMKNIEIIVNMTVQACFNRKTNTFSGW